MATTMQLSDLQAAARQRADMVNSQFVSDSELTSYINQSYFELYDLLVQEFGDNYFVAPSVTITADGTSQQYALPDGTLYSSAPALYKLLGVDANLGGYWISLKPYNFPERNKFGFPYQVNYLSRGPRYCLLGNYLQFQPIPSTGLQMRLWYVPRMTQLSSASDTVDGVSGWTEYIIIDSAIKMLQKQEDDVSVLMAQKQAMIARIQAAAENRDAGEPKTVSDSRQDFELSWINPFGLY